jgi:thiamine biosynthesis lipoprotein
MSQRLMSITRITLFLVVLASAVCPALAAARVCRLSGFETLFSDKRPAMGTEFEIHLYAADQVRAQELFEEAFDEIERIEAALSHYRPLSELSRINNLAPRSAVTTDPEVFALLERAFDHSRVSDGAFDITVGGLMKAWGFFRGAGRYPSEKELADARQQIGWQRVTLDPTKRSIRFLAPKLELDLGGIGKGYALDRVAALLREEGVQAALLSSGSSSIYAIGAPPGKKGWPVRVADPLDRTRTLSTVVLKDESLSTSGNYEKFFRLNGRVYCHIMDPRTGRPVEGITQTTVIAPEAVDSDALSKTTFVLGPERAAPILAKLPGTGAMIVTDKRGADRVAEIRWRAEVRRDVSVLQ